MKNRLLPLQLGCLATVIYLIVFLYNFPSSKDSYLYVFLWILGFFAMPTILSLIFGFGTTVGSYLRSFLDLFRPKNHHQYNEPKQNNEFTDYEDVTDNPEYKDKDNPPKELNESDETKQ
jgi:hypothetical protein